MHAKDTAAHSMKKRSPSALPDSSWLVQPTLKISSGSATALVLSCSSQMEAVRDRQEGEKEMGTRAQVPGQTSVLHFLSKLRRHASLEGAGPYFKRWKFDSSHRAASLDAKGLAG